MVIRDITRRGPDADVQLFGIEVELENVRTGDYDRINPVYWMIKGDGSLRNRGAEFITPPVTLEDAMESVGHLWRVARASRWQGTQRCGIHVHMDMGGRTPDQLRTVLAAYAAVEPVLMYRLCGPDREQNIYCVPWYRAPGDLRYIRRFLDHPSRGTIGVLGDTCKYTALYTGPLLRFNTIEFRAPPAYENVEDMERLLRVLDGLLDAAGDIGDEADVVDMMENDPLTGLQLLLPELADDESVRLIETHDSIGTANNFVRTKELGPWRFVGLEEAPQPADNGTVDIDMGRIEMQMMNVLGRRRRAIGDLVLEEFDADNNPFDELIIGE